MEPASEPGLPVASELPAKPPGSSARPSAAVAAEGSSAPAPEPVAHRPVSRRPRARAHAEASTPPVADRSDVAAGSSEPDPAPGSSELPRQAAAPATTPGLAAPRTGAAVPVAVPSGSGRQVLVRPASRSAAMAARVAERLPAGPVKRWPADIVMPRMPAPEAARATEGVKVAPPASIAPSGRSEPADLVADPADPGPRAAGQASGGRSEPLPAPRLGGPVAEGTRLIELGGLQASPEAPARVPLRGSVTVAQPRSAREISGLGRAEAAGPAAPAPTIQVTIGRVEIVATAQTGRPHRPRSRPQAVSLDEYLLRRSGGGGGA
jgi:hypothetical protein